MNFDNHPGRDRGPSPSSSPATFDPRSGSLLEQLIFRNRPIILLICLCVTLVLGLSLHNLKLNASFESVIPNQHPFIINYEKNKDNLGTLSGNTLSIVIRANKGTILDPAYLTAFRDINDKVFLLPGVDRIFMRSIWTSSVRWLAVTSSGLAGGPVMPENFNGNAASIAQLDSNIRQSGIIGTLIAPDYKSAVITVPLLDTDAKTGKPVDYGALSDSLDKIRAEYAGRGITIGITGFAMIVGNLLRGMHEILGFFAISLVITSAMVFWYTRCVRSTVLVVFCSLLAVCWQLGVLPYIGFSLDPYSVLVPFLVFAIGMSHGAQKMNGVMQDIGRGHTKLIAARLTFRRLFMAGFTALCCDAVGFAVLLTIKIPAIEHLATIASLGVAILIVTNLILLPVFLSYVGVSPRAARRNLLAEQSANEGGAKHPVWALLDLFTQRRYAVIVIGGAVCLGIFGLVCSRGLQVGDIDPGAPELRVHSLYNQDNKYFVEHYTTSSDILVAMVKTPYGQCANYKTLTAIDTLETQLNTLPGVVSTSSFADFERLLSVELNEGSFAWYDIIPNQGGLNQPIPNAPPGMVGPNCDFLPISVFLRDHRAATLTRVVDTVQRFAATHDDANATFLLAGGNAGIEAATNLVVAHASRVMLLEVYAAVILLSFITLRSWRAVVIAILPLILTSILAEALMVWLNIGVKVATLPVTALGVGIGVDYALYILSVTLANMRRGMDLSEAYFRALLFTGKVVMLTGFTLAAAVITWALSPIKFQADMGELLAFMFLWNMLGALVLLPALASFLLPQRLFPQAVPVSDQPVDYANV
jgi:predicted RND superfamily exporter protein